MVQTLFDVAGRAAAERAAPLAARLRPATLAELVGQDHLLGAGSPLVRLIAGERAQSVVLWGPPGTGKSTIAHLVSRAAGARFAEMSAVSAGLKEVREAVEAARVERGLHDRGTVLFVDEVHRFSRTQQDGLLPAVENGWVTLLAATTENPSYSMVSPLLSRCLLLTLAPLSEADLDRLVDRALADPRGFGGTLEVAPEARAHLRRLAGGDARRLLTALESGAAAAGGAGRLELAVLERAVDRAALNYDRAGDLHYSVVSAYIKAMRAGDAGAALHHLARMIDAGEDPRFIARRLMIAASEDVGLADPTALLVAVAAAQVVERVGLPEGRIALAHATMHLARAPKSTEVIAAVDAALAEVSAAGRDRYPHGFPGAVPVPPEGKEGP